MASLARKKADRDLVLKSSKQYYAHRAYYVDLLWQRRSADRETVKELAFLQSVFKKHSTRRVRKVLDFACGGGRHVVGLAQKGYECTGQDYTPERVEMARKRAARSGVSVELSQGDATKLRFESQFDAVLALNVLFLLPSDEDAAKCLTGAYKALRSGGVLVCSIYNGLATGTSEARRLTNSDFLVPEVRGRGIRITRIEKLKDYDPVLGVGWVHSTDVIEAPDGCHVYRDRERFRFFTYWDIMHLLSNSGFKQPTAYADWKTSPISKPKAEQIVFVARK